MSPAAAQSAPRERQSERELPALICAQSPTGGTPPPTATVGTQGGAQAGSPGESLGQCLLCPQASWSLKDWCSTPPRQGKGWEAEAQRGQRSGSQWALPWGGCQGGLVCAGQAEGGSGSPGREPSQVVCEK